MYKEFCKRVTVNKKFEFAITAVILLNSFLIGVETYTENQTIKTIQSCILGIFTIEIILRYIAAESTKAFFTDGWNIFDLSLVLIGYIPETMFANASAMTAIRVLRVFRVLRLLRAAKEIKIIITVLIKSMSAMFYNVILFGIFIYLYAIIITAKPKAHAFKNEMCFPLTKTKCELKKHPNSKFECFFNDFNRTKASLFLPFPSKLIQDNLVCVLELQE